MIKNKEVNSILWSGIERFSAQGAQFLLSILIARLVTPSDYGLIAMLTIFLSVAQQFVDSGFSNAIIQKTDRKEIDYYTVFYFNLIISIIIYAVLFWCSPYIAIFYSEPDLEIVAKWIGLNIILTAFYIVPRTKFVIDLNFKIQTKISFVAVVVSGVVGIVLASYGYGVWALVVQSLLNSLISLSLYWGLSKWKLKFIFSWFSFKTLFSFGYKLLVVGMLHVIFANIYTLIIGRRFAVTDVGYFNRSQTFATFPSVNITSIICRVLYPIQCHVQNDDYLFKRKFIQYLRATIYIVFPLMICLCVLAKPFILVVLNEKWLSISSILSILCIAYMWYPLTALNWQLLTAKGRSDLALKAEIVGKVLSILILLLTLPFGIMVICYGIIIANVVDIIIIIYYARKITGIGYLLELRILYPIVFISLIMSGGMYVTQFLFVNPYLQLIIGVIVGGSIYLSLSFMLKLEETRVIKQIFRKYIK
ncbi:lipopolysaccharide biosynthesis protein [Bacteroides thetaiotaomicron]|jgi:putative polysaccharide transporter/flippase|uniref:lipopolysaccharide biosynthesis protein n=2 Tax=Bacteroides thetaiotaomicron TaxID=818 RepID=UPI000E47A897|nr:lipopolysaccharide biosynthesis protein [Bacteroides thetaiotaomicron]RGX37887.1 lipopolysaccharide biosynthesis protein [Bacteroides thetaiotaomicron]